MTLLDALRQGTSEVHEALHDHPFMLVCFTTQLTPHAYAGFLRLFLERWQSLENSLTHHAAMHPTVNWLHLRIVSRVPVLYDDLGVLSHTGCDTPMSALHAIGHAYALVGSSKGARVLLAHVLRQLPGASTRYMSGVGDGGEWKELVEMLSALEVSQEDQAQIVAGAVQCFDQVRVGFDQLLHDSTSSSVHTR